MNQEKEPKILEDVQGEMESDVFFKAWKAARYQDAKVFSAEKLHYDPEDGQLVDGD